MMESSSTFTIFLALLLLLSSSFTRSASNNSNLFRAYIGAEFLDVKFSDLPINPSVEFHFILAFAIDYTNLSTPSPTNGIFNIFWDTNNLTPDDVINIKKNHPNVKVAISLGGDSVGKNTSAYFSPSSVDSWVDNAVSSLTSIIREYHLDGIDVDYEHFFENSEGIFVNCIGELISTLKAKGVVSFASIAPYDDNGLVERHYTTLWSEYGREMIDYVNFQFYAYEKGTNVSRFVEYFEEQRMVNYEGGRVLVSYISDGSVGIEPGKGFFRFAKRLKKMGRLYGIFVWCADESKRLRFKYEKKAQRMLAN